MKTLQVILPSWTAERRMPAHMIKPEDESLFRREFDREFGPVGLMWFDKVLMYPDSALEYRGKALIVGPQVEFCTEKIPWKTRLRRLAQLPRTRRQHHGLVITDPFYKGYFHWWCDCLPRYLLARPEAAGRQLVLPAGIGAFHKESLRILGISDYRTADPKEVLELEDVLIPSLAAPTGNYHAPTMRTLRDEVRARTAAGPAGNPSRLIYISRKRAPRRRLANEAALEPLFREAGFDIVETESLSLEQQILLMQETAVLAGMHGAGLTNMLFMPEGGRVLELRLRGDNHNNCYFSLASDLGHAYFYLECDPLRENEAQHTADLTANPEGLRRVLDRMITP